MAELNSSKIVTSQCSSDDVTSKSSLRCVAACSMTKFPARAALLLVGGKYCNRLIGTWPLVRSRKLCETCGDMAMEYGSP